MNQFEQLPPLTHSLDKLRLQERLDAIPHNTFIGYCIGNYRADNSPLQDIAVSLMEAYKDNPAMILRVVGEETLNLITRIYY
jgi:hypothetical protein